jgi:hypothetical protein
VIHAYVPGNGSPLLDINDVVWLHLDPIPVVAGQRQTTRPVSRLRQQRLVYV